MNYQTFETERLIIRPTLEKDVEFIFKLLNTQKWIKYIGDRNIKTIEDARNHIKIKMLPQLKKLGYSSFTLITKENNQKIGVCGLYDREGLEGVDLGFALLPNFEKKGFSFEAANRIKKAAFNEFGIDTLQAITTEDNIASQKLLKKLGFNPAGTTILPNQNIELLVFKINR